jgi:hypothetical protein
MLVLATSIGLVLTVFGVLTFEMFLAKMAWTYLLGGIATTYCVFKGI